MFGQAAIQCQIIHHSSFASFLFFFCCFCQSIITFLQQFTNISPPTMKTPTRKEQKQEQILQQTGLLTDSIMQIKEFRK